MDTYRITRHLGNRLDVGFKRRLAALMRAYTTLRQCPKHCQAGILIGLRDGIRTQKQIRNRLLKYGYLED